MKAQTFTEDIQIEEGSPFYSVKYPTFVFPNRCIVCGNPKETVYEYPIETKKTISSRYVGNMSAVENKFININTKVAIPLCNFHLEEQEQRDKGFWRFLLISATLGIILGIIAMGTLAVKGGYFPDKWLEGILISLFGGAIVGVSLPVALWFGFNEIKKRDDLKTYFPFIRFPPYEINLNDNPGKLSMSISLWIENDEIRSEVQALTEAKRRLDRKLK